MELQSNLMRGSSIIIKRFISPRALRLHIPSCSQPINLSSQKLVFPSQIKFSDATKKNDEPEIDKKELDRKINLLKLLIELKLQVPHLLESNLSKSIVSKNIYLRICPSQVDETLLPKIHGQLTYFSTCKAIQLFIKSVILNPHVQLHITNIKVSKGPDPQCMFKHSTKIYVRWNTCMPNCEHLGSYGKGSSVAESTSDANWGSHKWSKEDTLKLMDQNKLNNFAGLLGKLTTSVVGLAKNSGKEKLERVLLGLFIFELNDNCDEIVVHTIENMDIIERLEPEEINELRVC